MSFYVTLTFLNHCLNLSRCILDKTFVCSKNTTTHGSKCSKREHFMFFVVGKPSCKISSSIQKQICRFYAPTQAQGIVFWGQLILYEPNAMRKMNNHKITSINKNIGTPGHRGLVFLTGDIY